MTNNIFIDPADSNRGTCDAQCKRPNQILDRTHVPGFGICFDCLSKIKRVDYIESDRNAIRMDMKEYGIPIRGGDGANMRNSNYRLGEIQVSD